MTKEEMISCLRSCNEVAKRAVDEGHHPFGAILVGPNNEVLLEQGNVNTVRHAETELARKAAEQYTPEFLWKCALVTTFEPCAMCAGTLYWANIGKLIYGVSETKLLEQTGSDERNPTLSLPSRAVIDSGQKSIKVFGPFPEVEEEIMAPHVSFWDRD